MLPQIFKDSLIHIVVFEHFLEEHEDQIKKALKKGPLIWADLKYFVGTTMFIGSGDVCQYQFQSSNLQVQSPDGKQYWKLGPGGILKIAKDILNNQDKPAMTKTALPPVPVQDIISLKDITVSSSNPRKVFDEESIKELADSIREKGILQPILVRPKGKEHNKFELVCGERRYRASMIVLKEDPERLMIPAVIRSLTNDEALELQIIENLQRKDVHPMDEASAFRSLIDIKKFSVEEIARRIGKSPRFVAERLKLNNLSTNFQKAFFNGRMTMTDALRIAKLSEESQKALAKDHDRGENKIIVNNYVMRTFEGELNDAPFDLLDISLNKKMGACTNCQFNSASNNLFPEEALNPMCTHLPCFKIKSDASYKKELATAQNEPSIILVSDEYRMESKAKDLISKGNTVYDKQGYNTLHKPQPPESWDSFKEDNLDDYQNEKDCRKEYDGMHLEYQEDLKDYNKKIASGNYHKAFVVEGDDSGKYIYVEINKKQAAAKGSPTAVKAKEVAGTVSKEDLEAEMSRIRIQEKRKKELDGEKTNVQLFEFLKSQKIYSKKMDPLNDEEKDALVMALLESGGWQGTRDMEKIIGVSDDYDRLKAFKKLQSMPGKIDQLLNQLFRILIVEKIFAANRDSSRNGRAAALECMMIEIFNKEAKEILDGQEEEAKKRAERVEQRILQLKEKIKLLKPEAAKKAGKPSEKTPAPGKSKKGLAALLDNQEEEE